MSELRIASLYLEADTDSEAREHLVRFGSALATAYQLGHATRVAKIHGGGGLIELYAEKEPAPDWICECGTVNMGLLSFCHSTECEREQNTEGASYIGGAIE
ncbi:MAG: hypothetical protein M3P26_10510 [Gemmatimonadota bacterium]|nr:hypothetical protein [Gemmatimonadota bacterium]